MPAVENSGQRYFAEVASRSVTAVQLVDASTLVLVSTYNAAGTVVTPITYTANGAVQFYAEEGTYRLRVTDSDVAGYVYTDPFIIADVPATTGDALVDAEAAARAAADAAHAADALLHSSGQEIAYVENTTGTPYTLTNVATSLGLSVTLPQSTRPIWIHGSAWVDITSSPAASNTGTAAIIVVDDQGSPVTHGGDIMPIEPGGTQGFLQLKFECRIPPNTPSRTYTLQANRGGGTWGGNIMHGQVGIAFRTWLSAEYR